MNLFVPQDKEDYQKRNHPIDRKDMKEPVLPYPAHIAQPQVHFALTSLLQKKTQTKPKVLPARALPPETSGAPHPQQGAKRLGRSCSSCSLVGAHGAEGTLVGGWGGLMA